MFSLFGKKPPRQLHPETLLFRIALGIDNSHMKKIHRYRAERALQGDATCGWRPPIRRLRVGGGEEVEESGALVYARKELQKIGPSQLLLCI